MAGGSGLAARMAAVTRGRWVSRLTRGLLALAILALLHPISGGRIYRFDWIDGLFGRSGSGAELATAGPVTSTVDPSPSPSPTAGGPGVTDTSEDDENRSGTTDTVSAASTVPSSTGGPSSTVHAGLPESSSGGGPGRSSGAGSTGSSSPRTTATGPATTAEPRATFFSLAEGAGEAWSLTVGTYRQDAITGSPVGDDAISSIRIDGGLRVLACQHDDTKPADRGLCLSYVNRVDDLGPLDNQVSYIEVIRT